MVTLGPRAQAATVLALVGTLGALVGVLGDRMIAQRRSDALPVGDTLSILSQPQYQRPIPADTGEPMQPAEPGRSGQVRPNIGPRPGGAGGPGGPATPQMRFVEMLTERIDLSPSQRASIDSIVAEDRARIARVTQDTRTRIDSIGRSTRMRLSAVLTPQQRLEMRAIQQERMRSLTDDRRARMGAGRGRSVRRGGDTISSGGL